MGCLARSEGLRLLFRLLHFYRWFLVTLLLLQLTSMLFGWTGQGSASVTTAGAPASTTTATCGKPVCTWHAFGPKTYTKPINKQHEDDDRDDKDQLPFTDTFSVQNSATKYTLHVIG